LAGFGQKPLQNGDFYWVDACVVPVRRNEQTIGYMSVRKRAEPAAITHAQALYQQIPLNGMPSHMEAAAMAGHTLWHAR
jgi:aerotaxis receptor